MKSKNFKSTINIVKHIMLSNHWEYFITDEVNEENPDILFALVMGFETELGYVSYEEIKPHIKSMTMRLDDLLPAEGWEWV